MTDTTQTPLDLEVLKALLARATPKDRELILALHNDCRAMAARIAALEAENARLRGAA